MSTATLDRRSARWPGLVGFLVATFAVAGIGSVAAVSGVEGWYAAADKPSFTPPDAVFGPVWTVLYALMAVSAWRVVRHAHRDPAAARTGLRLWWVQLALNLAWTPLFFGAEQLWGAVPVIVALDVVLVLTTARFRRVDGVAAALLVPYVVWTLYATALNVGLAVLS